LGRRVGVAAIFWATLFAVGCGGGSSSDTGQVRFLQASPSAPHIDLLIDGTTQSSNMAYGNSSGYISVKAGSRHLQAVPVNSTSPLLDLSVSITSSGNTTVLLTGPGSSVKSLVLTDGGTTSSTGNGYVRVVNASVSMGPADVYIVAAGSGINGATPAATNLALNQDGGYHLTPAGSYEVFMTSPGTKSILLDTGPINLTSLQNWTLVALDGTSGGFTFELLQDQ
jgi:Domain of unknown function (DUF4397)